jgi:anthranilate/para-aminobenzoate synthase component I
MYFLNLGELQVVGSSPEMLVKVQGRDVSSAHRRHAPARRERRGRRRLDTSYAARSRSAEHVMLVDLGRNDIGRACKYGSVKVSELMTVERYSHVMHSSPRHRRLGAGVMLRRTRRPLPAGTVTGAPTVRATQIVVEPAPRPYGHVCYLTFPAISTPARYPHHGDSRRRGRRPEAALWLTGASSRIQSREQGKALLAAIELAEEGLV